MSRRYTTTGRNNWDTPKPPLDPSLRQRMYGKIVPAEEKPGFFARLLGRR